MYFIDKLMKNSCVRFEILKAGFDVVRSGRHIDVEDGTPVYFYPSS
jgi:hypothetical protein